MLNSNDINMFFLFCLPNVTQTLDTSFLFLNIDSYSRIRTKWQGKENATRRTHGTTIPTYKVLGTSILHIRKQRTQHTNDKEEWNLSKEQGEIFIHLYCVLCLSPSLHSSVVRSRLYVPRYLPIPGGGEAGKITRRQQTGFPSLLATDDFTLSSTITSSVDNDRQDAIVVLPDFPPAAPPGPCLLQGRRRR